MAYRLIHGNEVAYTIFKITGNKFDPGNTYKFHDDLSGEVIHEIKVYRIELNALSMSDISLPAQLYSASG
jgi:hypothetical protein